MQFATTSGTFQRLASMISRRHHSREEWESVWTATTALTLSLWRSTLSNGTPAGMSCMSKGDARRPDDAAVRPPSRKSFSEWA